MRGVQFFVGVANDEHPCSHLHNPIVTSRNLRTTPALSFAALHFSIPPAVTTTPGSTRTRFLGTWSLHSQTLSWGSPSPPSPPISEEELLLTRANRVHLGRLRCAHHPSIAPYEHRIKPDLDPLCKWCQGVPETVPHLFEECPNLVGHRRAENISSVRMVWDSPSSSLSLTADQSFHSVQYFAQS